MRHGETRVDKLALNFDYNSKTCFFKGFLKISFHFLEVVDFACNYFEFIASTDICNRVHFEQFTRTLIQSHLLWAKQQTMVWRTLKTFTVESSITLLEKKCVPFKGEMVALSPKCYYAYNEENNKVKKG